MTKWSRRVLELVKKIPRGRVTTYQALARALGRPGAYRAVGNALAKNVYLIKIPCHRVICSDGKVGGYQKGRREKERLLKSEGVLIANGRLVNKKQLFNF